ncbi:cell wall-binding repeat-containing protein [Euzebya sp.]|uniref:cell wall-binding repeat-containing protein n=1 Tax=Euzebya sp. TaxID=1971409 RepID=UPI003519949D
MSQTTTDRLMPLAALVAVVLAWAVMAPPAAAVDDVTPARVEGPNRFATAAAIADQAFPQGTEQAVVTTAAAAQDALTATSLAGASGAAMLLVELDRVPDETASALEGLGVQGVTIVGGELGVSAAVEAQLAERYEVRRIAGETQYDTAALVSAATAQVADLPVVDGRRTVMLADGEDFPDALAGSPAAFAGPIPVLYAETGDLRDETRAFLAEQAVEQVVVLGGEAAIGAAVQAELEADGITVVRLGGQDRTQTAERVAAWTTANVEGFTRHSVMLARGDDFPDALTAGQLAGRAGRALVLATTPEILSPGTRAFLAARCADIEVVQAVGGEAAVSTAVLAEAEGAAESCGGSGTGGDPVDDAVPDYAMTAEQREGQPRSFVGDNPFKPIYGTGFVDTVAATELDGATSLDAVMFACEAVEVDADGSAVLTDADGDGMADAYGSSSASEGDDVVGPALITGANNVDVDDDTAVSGLAPEDGRLGVQVSAYADDCATLLVFPTQPDGLPVDDAGRPTVPYGASEIRFGDHPVDDGTGGEDPDDGLNPTQVYRVEPQQRIDAAAGQTADLTVDGRFDGAPITRGLDVILFPCSSTDVLGSGPDTFTDADGDGGADGFTAGTGSSDTGAMLITAINGQTIEARTAVGGVQAVDGQIDIRVAAESADCATVVVVAGDGNGKFDVDAQGVPTEDYGVGQVRFS